MEKIPMEIPAISERVVPSIFGGMYFTWELLLIIIIQFIN